MESFVYFLYGYLFYYFCAYIGITKGYHRYFSHNQFKASALTEIIMLYFGLLCGGRSPLTWCAVHKMHHAYADTPLDPHSSKFNSWYIIFFSLWRVQRIPRRFVKPLMLNPRIMWFHKYGKFVLLAHWILTFLIFSWPALIINGTIYITAYLGFGTLNLFGHNMHGPINNIWINLIAPFEGNHKDHHASPGLK